MGQNSGYESDDLDDEEKLLQALIRSEMGEDAVWVPQINRAPFINHIISLFEI